MAEFNSEQTAHPRAGERVIETVDAGRREIDEIDDQLLALLNERAGVAIAINAIKRRDNKSRFDVTREDEILARMTALNKGPLSEEQVSAIFLNLFAVTKEAQESAAAGTAWPQEKTA